MSEILALAYYKSLYKTDLTPANLLERVVTMMMFVENEKSIQTGAMKQSVVIYVIEKVMQDTFSETDIIGKTLISTLLPGIMEMIIKADKNQIYINKKTVLTLGGMLKCISCVFPNIGK